MRHRLITAAFVLAISAPALASQHPTPHGQPSRDSVGARRTTPLLQGQDAYAAIAEIVQLLEADSATNWRKVDLEKLRQHLIDMDRVVLGATVREVSLARGLQMDVTGSARTLSAIVSMVTAHAAVLDEMPEWSASARRIHGGVRLVVVAESGDAPTIDRIRGLGFIGLLATGAHHQAHHLALARGEGMSPH